MIRVHELQVFNFGPFRGRHVLAFPPRDGVVVIRGQNGRGKTTLLNAIRFALFGEVLGRRMKLRETSELLNQVARGEGERTFAVQLDVERGGQRFVVQREVEVSGIDPEQQAKVTTSVSCDGRVLSQMEGEEALATLLPVDVSRFFLFDGELLEQYEGLLDSQDLGGKQIASAIESILGLPVLKRLRDDWSRVVKRCEDEEVKALKSNKKLNDEGKALESAQVLAAGHRQECEQRESEVSGYRSELSQVEADQRKNSKAQQIFGQIDAHRDRRDDLNRKMEDLRYKLTEQCAEAWQWPLRKVIQQRHEELRVQIVELETAQRTHLRQGLIDELRIACQSGECPVCGQSTEGASLQQPGTVGMGGGELAGGLEAELLRLRASREGVRLLSRPDQALRIQGSMDEAAAEIAHLNSKIRDLEEQVVSVDRFQLDRLHKKAKQLQEALTLSEVAARAARKEYDDAQVTIQAIRKRIEAAGSPVTELASQRRECAERVRRLLEESLRRYKMALKDKVEEGASKLFVSMTSEPEYVGLRINEHYGLHIRHRDGEDVVGRSSGNEHLVALALIGALQQNAPVNGVVFSDSPLGRIDSEHRRRILRVLPSVSPQFILLVYDDELPDAMVGAELGERLIAEYELRRVSARETIIAGRKAF